MPPLQAPSCVAARTVPLPLDSSGRGDVSEDEGAESSSGTRGGERHCAMNITVEEGASGSWDGALENELLTAITRAVGSISLSATSRSTAKDEAFAGAKLCRGSDLAGSDEDERVAALGSAVENICLSAPVPDETVETTGDAEPCLRDDSADSGEGSESDDSSSDEEEEEGEKRGVRSNLTRSPIKSHKVLSKDGQAGGNVYYQRPAPDNTLRWSSYHRRLQGFINHNNVGITNFNPDTTILWGDEVQKCLQDYTNKGPAEHSRFTQDYQTTLFGPVSPESNGGNRSPPLSDSGVGSMLSPASPSRTGSPPHPVLPVTARQAIVNSISQDEKEEALLKINNASMSKLMREDDPDGDTNLTVLVRSWEKHGRPLALLYAMVERMKFVKNGLSRKTKAGDSALRLAALFAHADPLVAKYIAEMMVLCGDDINEVDAQGNTVIHSVCAKGDPHAAVLRELLSVPQFNVNLANKQGETPLEIAIEKGATEMERLLLRSGGWLSSDLDQVAQHLLEHWPESSHNLSGLHAGVASSASGLHAGVASSASGLHAGVASSASGLHAGVASSASGLHAGVASSASGLHAGVASSASGLHAGVASSASGLHAGVASSASGLHAGVASSATTASWTHGSDNLGNLASLNKCDHGLSHPLLSFCLR
ncbi:uncharacterized protein LOC134537506 isoform X2 [Bacillus rossius redtenbacheri]